MEMLSPGEFSEEINASTIVPTVSNSIAVFAGQFDKGPIGDYSLITTIDDLISIYGLPSDYNYSDWYQAFNFLQYGNKLYVSRTGVTNAGTPILANAYGSTSSTGYSGYSGEGDWTVFADTVDANVIPVNFTSTLTIGDRVAFGNTPGTPFNTILGINKEFATTVTSVISQTEIVVLIAFNPAPNDTITINGVNANVDTVTPLDDYNILSITPAGPLTIVSGNEILIPDSNIPGTYTDSLYFGQAASITAAEGTILYKPTEVSTNTVGSHTVIGNFADFEGLQADFTLSPDSALIIARNPGSWGNNIRVRIALNTEANPTFLKSSDVAPGAVYPYTGKAFNDGTTPMLVDLFEYAPDTTNLKEVAVIIKSGTEIVETFLVSLNKDSKDHTGKSNFFEDVINRQSEYIFIVYNDTTQTISDFEGLLELGADIDLAAGTPDVLDLASAYEVWDNKELVDIDIVIGNEADTTDIVKNLCDLRKDCIGFIGAVQADVVGHKASVAVSNLTTWKSGLGTSMFLVVCGNYKYQYDRYNDKNRWINIAGDIAGLRAQTSMNRASWWASAGLERGQIKNVRKLGFNPNQGQRDILYKAGINPIVAFPGQGTVMWGQKTMLDKPSSFDRVNVRGLFNTLERSLGKMAKYQVMEFNDNFTRNRIISMIKPFLGSVQAGRGIQDFLVICDTSNNTADVISRNQLVVDVYIKPTYVSEFILLRYTNAGVNSFSEIIGG